MDPPSDHPLAAFGPIGDMLLETLRGDRVSPSYLFEGSDPDMVRDAAWAFAGGLLTGAPPAPLDMAELTRVLDGHHADLHELTKDKATVISVKALAAVLGRAHMTPLEGGRQVFVIEPADAMEPEGIARYLKSLEEPPDGTTFLLLTCNAERLPDTVLSRCRRVRFPPLEAGRIAERLAADGVANADAAFAARVAGGSLTVARRVADAGLHAVLADLLAAAAAVEPGAARAAEGTLAHLTHRAGEMAAADASEADTKRQHVRVLLADLLRVFAVEARERAAGRTSALAPAVHPEGALDLLETIGELVAATAANVTPAVVILETVAALTRTSSGRTAVAAASVR